MPAKTRSNASSKKFSRIEELARIIRSSRQMCGLPALPENILVEWVESWEMVLKGIPDSELYDSFLDAIRRHDNTKAFAAFEIWQSYQAVRSAQRRAEEWKPLERYGDTPSPDEIRSLIQKAIRKFPEK